MARLAISRSRVLLRPKSPGAPTEHDRALRVAVLLVIALAPIGWANALAQLSGPTDVSAPAARTARVPAARQAGGSLATVPTATATPPALQGADHLTGEHASPEPGAAPSATATATSAPTLAPSPTQLTPPAPPTAPGVPPPPPSATAAPPTPRPSSVGAATYVVQPGDTVWSIATRYGVTVGQIRSANGLDDAATIRVGQTLVIPRVQGEVHVVSPSDPADGATAPTPTPVPMSSPSRTPTPPRPASASSPSEVRGTLRLASAPASSSGGPEPRLRWPAVGAISTFHGEDGHTGIDIMGQMGQPVFVAGAGRVILTVESDDGYGWRIDIDHGGGLTTRYAHLSAFAVRVGDQVSAGQLIGAVGNSGWSTGPHLHFEVHQGGVPVDPLTYLR